MSFQIFFCFNSYLLLFTFKYIRWMLISSIWCWVANICYKPWNVIGCVSYSTCISIWLNYFVNSNSFFRITSFSVCKLGIFFINYISKFISISSKLLKKLEFRLPYQFYNCGVSLCSLYMQMVFGPRSSLQNIFLYILQIVNSMGPKSGIFQSVILILGGF